MSDVKAHSDHAKTAHPTPTTDARAAPANGAGPAQTAWNPVVQSTYPTHIAPGYAGQIASEIDARTVITRFVGRPASTPAGQAAPPIPFGVAVSQGPKDNDVLLGGTLANYIGCSVRDATLVNNPADQYAETQNLGVLVKGDIFVAAKTAYTAHGAVYFDAATGQYQASGGSGPIPNAYWRDSGAAGDITVVRFL
jgi:hypothetical protein